MFRFSGMSWRWGMMMLLSGAVVGSCTNSRAISELNIVPSGLKLNLRGAVSLETLRGMLNEQGVELVIQGDPNQQLFCRGQVYVEELPALIQGQTGYVVVRYGKRWVVQDLGNKIPVQSLGTTVGVPFELVDPDTASARRLTDQMEAGANTYILELAVLEFNGSAGTPSSFAGPGLTVSGGGTIATVTAVAGEEFEYHDGQTIFVNNSLLLPNTQAVATTQSARQTGLILKGKLRELPGRIELRGSFELSQADGTSSETTRQVTLPPLLRVDEWLPVASLTSAAAKFQLKPFGINVSGGTYRLCVRVRLLAQ